MSEYLLIGLFVLGYFAITLEHCLDVNKAGVALLMAAGCWAILQVFIFGGDHAAAEHGLAAAADAHGHHGAIGHLTDHLGEIAQIVLFLLGAMAIVELMAEYRAFDVLQRRIAEGGINTVLWGVPVVTFFMSAVLDNVTSTILMLSILRPLVPARQARLLMAGVVVISANAGGAWSPIGDVTTTMLWIDDRVSTTPLVLHVLIPSIVCAVVPLLFLAKGIKRSMAGLHPELRQAEPLPFSGPILFLGVGCLLFVPVVKVLTGLPPYVGILFGLGVVWVVTDVIDSAAHLKVPHVLGKIDVSSILFFLGILLAVAALETAGTLGALAGWLDRAIGDLNIILAIFGVLSAIVDNVPLTAAAMGMYDTGTHPPDSMMWHLTAYCAGTGGSILVIGSAAGVVAMGMENIGFGWWLKNVGLVALIGYFAGFLCFLGLNGPVLTQTVPALAVPGH